MLEESRELLKPGETWQGQCLCKEGPAGRCVNLRSWKPNLQSGPQMLDMPGPWDMTLGTVAGVKWSLAKRKVKCAAVRRSGRMLLPKLLEPR